MEQLPKFFRKSTREWFRESLGEPTLVQTEAWPKIHKKDHVLISAPTGTGKTLTAFLVLLDHMMEQAERGELVEEL